MCLEFTISKDGGKQPLQRSTFYRRPGQLDGTELVFKFTQHMVHQVLHLNKQSSSSSSSCFIFFAPFPNCLIISAEGRREGRNGKRTEDCVNGEIWRRGSER